MARRIVTIVDDRDHRNFREYCSRKGTSMQFLLSNLVKQYSALYKTILDPQEEFTVKIADIDTVDKNNNLIVRS
jgi:hypothetical protein